MLEQPVELKKVGWGFAARLAVMLALGAITSGAALTLVFLVTRSGMNLMNWTVEYIVPVGPIVVGLLASSGFSLGARVAGVRVRGASLAAVCLMLVGAYLAAEYIGYRVEYPNGVTDYDGALLNFWTYLDFMTQETHFEGKSGLGLLGYGLRLIGMAGFVVGGIYGPLMFLANRPHCAKCNRFHRRTVVAHLPEDQASLDDVLANTADGRQLATKLRTVAPAETWEATSHLEARILFRFSRCTSCNDGLLVWEKLAGFHNQDEGRELGRQPLPPERVTQFLSVWNAD